MESSKVEIIKRESMYRAFEERHRGSREMIINRLKVYLPFVLPLKEVTSELKTVDLGCGRGEWLELLGESGFAVSGVDLDEGMLMACKERFSVQKGDAIEFLQSLPDESSVIVSAFHLVEHIPFDSLQVLIKEALRVLKPGGLLIMETPNTENLVVGSVNFYLDPTHERPLPLALLSFLTDYFGFFRSKQLGLQENPELCNSTTVSLIEVLAGVSPDGAVIAQKKAEPECLQLFDQPFSREYGVTLGGVAQKYDVNIAQNIAGMSQDILNLTQKISELEERLKKTDSSQSEYPIDNEQPSNQQVSFKRVVGKKLRWIMKGSIAWLTFSAHSRPRRVLKKGLIIVKQRINNNPQVKRWLVRILSCFPSIKARLKRVGNVPAITDYTAGLEALPPRVGSIYRSLKVAMKQNRT